MSAVSTPPLLCAVACGGLQLLGRADDMKEYIRRGCDKGWVETTLSGGPGSRDHVVRCDLIKNANGSYRTEWRLNRECNVRQEYCLSRSVALTVLCT